MFIAIMPIVVGSHLLVAVTGGLPRIDIEKNCRESADAMYGTTTASVFDACVADEKDAGAELAKKWASFPSADKARCVHAEIYLPSYVEWLTCIEGEGTLRRLRNAPAAPRG